MQVEKIEEILADTLGVFDFLNKMVLVNSGLQEKGEKERKTEETKRKSIIKSRLGDENDVDFTWNSCFFSYPTEASALH